MNLEIPQNTPAWSSSPDFLPTVTTQHLQQRETQSVTATVAPTSSCCPNQVIIELSTTLLIPDYTRYYTTPINQFQVSYFPLADGSIITPPFIDDLVNSNISLLVTGMLTMLFARNLFVSADYLRRTTIKKKNLFKVLFASQLLASAAFIPTIISQFYKFPSCTVVNIITCIATAISLALLITWILGYKAYRCLNNARWVIVCLALFLCASTTVFILEMLGLRSERRLSGGCMRTSDLLYTRIYIILQLVQSFFISSCFFYAVYKSRGSPVARGRVSIRLSIELSDNDAPAVEGRGWWDYVPKEQELRQEPLPRKQSFISSTLSSLLGNHNPQTRPLHKPSAVISEAVPQAPRPATVRITETQDERPSSPVPSFHSRLSRYIPRMELFREVMRDELLYTTFITTSCVVVAVLALIGVNVRNGLTVSGWIILNWAVISLLAIHSFGRVIQRHERDAILQEPGSWQPNRGVHVSGSRTRQQHAPSLAATHRRPWRKESTFDDKTDPFSETRGLNDSRDSWSSYSTQSEPVAHQDETTVSLPGFLSEQPPRLAEDLMQEFRTPELSTGKEDKNYRSNGVS